MNDEKKPETPAQKIKREEAEAKEAEEVKTKALEEAREKQYQMNQSPTMTVIESFDPAGNRLQKEIQIGPRQASSVQLSMDSKGTIKPEIKIYHENPEEAYSIAIKLMTEMMNELGNLDKD